MKRILVTVILCVTALGVNAQDNYNKKYSLGASSTGKWYKLFEIDLEGNGNHNSVNIALDFNYVNTWIKYNSSAFIRLRESTSSSISDWQNNVVGLKQAVLKLKKTGVKTYELWGYSNGGYGHMSFECSVTKEANLIFTIPDVATLVPDVNIHEDVTSRGEWYYSSGDFIISNGDVGIGTTDTKGFKLGVQGKIAAEEVKVSNYANWADFVFNSDYNLPTLQEVEQHIKANGHLKDIPSAEEVKKEGFFLGEMDSKLLQKIEELMLYTIEQQKEIEAQKTINKHLEEIIALQEKRIERIDALLILKTK